MNGDQGDIKIIETPISKADARKIGAPWYQELVKGVVDVEKGVLALGGEYHMDANTILIAYGSQQDHVWGFNIYPNRDGEEWIEFISLINIRPAAGNRGMMIDNPVVRDAMRAHIERLII